MIGIYKIKNTMNGKIYIGQSWYIEQRWNGEKKGHYINKHLKNAIKKYGIENFSFEIEFEMSVDAEQTDLDEFERFYIGKYKSYNPNFGYNKTNGGSSGKQTMEVRELMSKRRKGKRAWNKGISPSEEIRKKISESGKGRMAWNKGKKLPRLSEERKKQLSIMNKGEKNAMFGKNAYSKKTKEELKEIGRKISVANKGRKKSIEEIQKISNTKKGKKLPQTVCPYCGKIGSIMNLKCWHFEKCKEKKNASS